MHQWAQGRGSCPHSFMSALNAEEDQHRGNEWKEEWKNSKEGKEMVDEKITWRETRGKGTQRVDVNYPGLKGCMFMSRRQKSTEIIHLQSYVD